jgi:hypothetical protein
MLVIIDNEVNKKNKILVDFLKGPVSGTTDASESDRDGQFSNSFEVMAIAYKILTFLLIIEEFQD